MTYDEQYEVDEIELYGGGCVGPIVIYYDVEMDGKELEEVYIRGGKIGHLEVGKVAIWTIIRPVALTKLRDLLVEIECEKIMENA